MTHETRRSKWRWLRHVAWVLAAKLFLILLAVIGIVIFFGSGVGNPIIQRLIVRRLNSMTGGHAELSAVSIRWFSLEIRLKGLVIHGKEPAGTEPLFAADEVQAGLRIDSFWGRKVSLRDLLVQVPRVHIRIEKNGSTNVPAPPKASATKPVRETLFDLRIRRVQLQNGWVLYNDVRSPLALEGDNLRLALDAGDSLILFPEGTRSNNLEPRPFKSGLFHLAKRCPQVEFVPVYLENLNRILPKGEFLPVPLLGSVTIGAPVRLEQGETKDSFLKRARTAVWNLHRT
jgi:hypothetical protein